MAKGDGKGHNKRDLTGMRFERWTVLSEAGRLNGGVSWNCLCDCGVEKVVRSSSLVDGLSGSCGCLQKENTAEKGRNTRKHGMSTTRPYKIWQMMLSRCRCETNKVAFSFYGERGITFDPKWISFEGFWEEMEEGYSSEFEIDRIDVNGNYCKENCRWVGKSLQQYNKRKYKTNSSGRTGVNFHPKTGKWQARIAVEGKRVYLGLYEDFEDAVKAREEAELKYFGFNKE